MPLLKLKNASYPEPDALALVNEYDLGRDGSTWKHGWVPTNAIAAAIHAKKPTSAAKGSKGKSRLSVTKLEPQSRAKVAGAKGRLNDVQGKRDPFTGETRMESLKRTATDLRARGASQSAARHRREMRTSEQGKADVKRAEQLTSTPAGRADVKARAKSVISDGKNMSAADHTRMAIHHNEEAKKALDAGDRTKANAHVEAMRAHNSAAIAAGTPEQKAKVAAGLNDVVKTQLGDDLTKAPSDRLRTFAQFGHQGSKDELARRSAKVDPKTTNSTGLRTLGGYGTNDLKAIAGKKGSYASNPPSADTVAKAEAELKSRGYVQSKSGAWVKPKAPMPPQRKQSVPALKGRATPVKRGTKSIAGVRFKPGQ